MRPRYFLHLLRLHLRQHPGRAALAFVVLLVASTLMLLLAGAGATLKFRVGGRLARVFPEERVRLEARRAALGPIAVEAQTITTATVAALRERPDVREVLPIEPVRVPVSVQGRLFGQEITSDAVIHGVPRELVADAIKPDQPWRMSTDVERPYPLVASRYFLDLYNLGLARSSGLPLISPDAIIGRRVYVIFGQSSVLPLPSKKEPEVIRAEVVGLSADPALIGLAMPADAVRAFNKAFGNDPQPRYIQLVVKLKSGTDTEAFTRDVGRWGLTLAGGELIGRRIKSAVALAGGLLIGLAAGVFLLGLMTFYLLFAMTFHARRLDLVRLRALGVGPLALLGLALGEVSVVAVAAVAVAGALNLGLMERANALAGPWLADQGWLPPDLLAPSIGWLALTSAAILAATLVAALPMLRWVFRVEPGTVIRDL